MPVPKVCRWWFCQRIGSAVTELYAGCATTTITPPLGIAMGGYWERSGPATAIGDALWAKALVFSCAGESCALVALDLVALGADSVRRIRGRLEAEVGIAADAVMVCASHTHAGPLTLAFRGMGALDTTYIQSVEDAVVVIVQRAYEQLQVATLRYARPAVQSGINRRRAGGPVIPYAHVAIVEGCGETLAVLFSHACHPVVLGAENSAISADFVGAAARYIEAQTRCPALFVNGACGDINPRHTNGDAKFVEILGAELGTAVVSAIAAAEPLAVSGLGRGIRCLELPLLLPLSRLRAAREHLVLRVKARLRQMLDRDGGVARAARARLAWARDVSIYGEQIDTQLFSIQALAVGPLVLLGMAGEVFARYQLDIEGAAEEIIMLCGYANGCIGYVPTADEYERGGYEIEEAYKVYPSVCMIAPESEVLIRTAVVELVADLRVGA
jgi:neutral ceramidase